MTTTHSQGTDPPSSESGARQAPWGWVAYRSSCPFCGSVPDARLDTERCAFDVFCPCCCAYVWSGAPWFYSHGRCADPAHNPEWCDRCEDWWRRESEGEICAACDGPLSEDVVVHYPEDGVAVVVAYVTGVCSDRHDTCLSPGERAVFDVGYRYTVRPRRSDDVGEPEVVEATLRLDDVSPEFERRCRKAMGV